MAVTIGVETAENIRDIVFVTSEVRLCCGCSFWPSHNAMRWQRTAPMLAIAPKSTECIYA